MKKINIKELVGAYIYNWNYSFSLSIWNIFFLTISKKIIIYYV